MLSDEIGNEDVLLWDERGRAYLAYESVQEWRLVVYNRGIIVFPIALSGISIHN